jgi:hypothetical protein
LNIDAVCQACSGATGRAERISAAAARPTVNVLPGRMMFMVICVDLACSGELRAGKGY